MDVFLDSFENTEHYLYFQDDGDIRSIDIANDEYVIIQKSTHPTFDLQENDLVIYYNENGETACQRLAYITAIGPLLKYHLADHATTESGSVIYDSQVIGKVVTTVENTLLNTFCLQIWDIAISQLNIHTLLENHYG